VGDSQLQAYLLVQDEPRAPHQISRHQLPARGVGVPKHQPEEKHFFITALSGSRRTIISDHLAHSPPATQRTTATFRLLVFFSLSSSRRTLRPRTSARPSSPPPPPPASSSLGGRKRMRDRSSWPKLARETESSPRGSG